MIDKIISLFFDKKKIKSKKITVTCSTNRIFSEGYKRFTLNDENKNRPLSFYFKDLKGLKNRNKNIIYSLYSQPESRQFSRIYQ